jgi:hypothetical protein
MEKTYKTSEMIAMLEKNPKFYFTDGVKIGHVYDDGGAVVSNTVGFVNDKLCWIRPDGTAFSLFAINKETIKMDWQLVRTPVTWQEAIQAWVDGKTVKCYYPENEKGIISKTFYPSCIGPTREVLLTGTWYIEDCAND